MPTLAPHLDQLELADSLRDHVFTLVRAGEMNAALILIRADVHSAVAALTAAAEANARLAVAPPVAQGDPEDEAGEDETEDGTEGETKEETKDDGDRESGDDIAAQRDPESLGTVKKLPVQVNAG